MPVFFLVLTVLLAGSAGAMMETVFTYQGRLMDADVAADGIYDFEFRLYNTNDPCVGNQQGSTVEVNDLDVINGYFTAELDFGSDVFNGDRVWLGISVRPGDSNDVFTSLIPRQEVTPTPYALHSRGIFVDDNGNVGIGTKSPNKKLTVQYGDFAVYPGPSEPSIITDGYNIKLGDPDGIGNQVFLEIDDLTEKFIFNNGNVGIGTKNPLNNLHVYDSGSAYALLESDSVYAFFVADGHRNSGLTIKEDGTNKAHVYWDTANDSLSLNEGGVDRLVVKGGKVGIGTTSPQADLEVKNSSVSLNVIQATASDGSDLFYVGEHGALGNGYLGVKDGDGTSKVFITANGYSYFDGGNVGIGTTYPLAKLHVEGMARVEAVQITGADVAEKFPVSEEVKPGMVVTIDTENQGQLCLSRGAYNRCVAGVVSGAKGLPAGAILGNLPGHEDAVPIALSGRVWVYCDTTEKAVEPGDMLTTSTTAGHAMAVTDYSKAHGAVLGKAMTSLEQGQTGLVLTLINLQ
jgi:hypothetical protein